MSSREIVPPIRIMADVRSAMGTSIFLVVGRQFRRHTSLHLLPSSAELLSRGEHGGA